MKINLKNKKILITGNTGFIGGWLSLVLHEYGSKVLGISKDSKKNYLASTKEYKKKIKTIYIDIKNIKKKKKEILKFKPEYIIHLASQPIVISSYTNPIYTYENNIISSIKFYEFLKTIKTIKKIIILTSDKVYKSSKNELNENDPLGGSDPYSVSKSSQHIVSNYYASKIFQNTQTIIIRAGNVIGGGDMGKFRLIVDIMKSIKNKKKLIIRNINAIRPWQHIYDLVYVIIKLLLYKSKNKLEIFNVSGNKKSQISVKKIIKIFKKKFSFEIKIIKSKLYENKTLFLNSSKLNQTFKNLKYMSIKSSINETINWYNKCYINKKKTESKYNFSKNQIISYLKNY